MYTGGWSVLRETSAMASVIKHWAGCGYLEKLGGSHEEQVACLKLEAKVCNVLSLFQRVKHLGLFDGGAWHRRRPRWETKYTRSKFKPKVTLARNLNTLFISCMLLAVWWNTRGNWTNKESTMETARLGKEWFEKTKTPSMGLLHMVSGSRKKTWFLVLGHHSIQLSGIPTALTSLAILFTGWGKGLEVCRYYWFWWW